MVWSEQPGLSIVPFARLSAIAFIAAAEFLCATASFQMLFASPALADDWRQPFKANACTGPGLRQYSSRLMNIVGSWEAACAVKPADINGQHFDRPNRCINNAGMWGEFDVADSTCGGLTITGTISYDDGDTAPRPYTFGKIEVWACGNRIFGSNSCSWSFVALGATDASGRVSIPVTANRDPTDDYQVRVVAENDAAVVWQQDTGTVFFADAGTAARANPNQPTLDFSRSFGSTGNDGFVSMHLNAAQKLRPAWLFMSRFRDPSELDTIGKVLVGPASGQTLLAFTNSGVIRVRPQDMRDERTLVHEYGHFIQESIGTYFPDPRSHSSCGVTSPEYAFFEGFPEAFSQMVRLYYSGEYVSSVAPMTSKSYGGPGCPATGSSVEGMVTDGIFLLFNDTMETACGPVPRSSDVNYPAKLASYSACVRPVWDQRASLIMGIIDKEFDWDTPGEKRMERFRTAWLIRGGDPASMKAVLAATGVPEPVPVDPLPSSSCMDDCAAANQTCRDSIPGRGGSTAQACAAELRACRSRCR